MDSTLVLAVVVIVVVVCVTIIVVVLATNGDDKNGFVKAVQAVSDAVAKVFKSFKKS